MFILKTGHQPGGIRASQGTFSSFDNDIIDTKTQAFKEGKI